MDTKEKEIRSFIVENFLYGQDDGTLKSDDSFLEKGIIDSTGILELVSYLESKFHVKIEDRELVPENLDSLEKLVRFVEKKQKGG